MADSLPPVYDEKMRAEVKLAEFNAARTYLKHLSMIRCYNFTETLRQRVFGPPIGDENKIYDYRHDVYIYNIPFNCYENSFLQYFYMIGGLHELKFFFTHNGYARGFAFASYKTIEQAQKAARLLKHIHFRGHNIKVRRSTSTRLIALAGIDAARVPYNMTEQEYVLGYLQNLFHLVLRHLSIRILQGGILAYVMEFHTNYDAVQARSVLFRVMRVMFGNYSFLRWGYALRFAD